MSVIDVKIAWVATIAKIVKIVKIVIVALMYIIREINNILLAIISAKITKSTTKNAMKKKSDISKMPSYSYSRFRVAQPFR